MQGHEAFLFVVNAVIRRFCFRRFLETCDSSYLHHSGPESKESILIRVAVGYKSFCNDWEEGLDELTVSCAYFLKMMDGYQQCYNGSKNGNTWLVEVEGLLWTGAFEISGKKNYVTKTVHHTDTLYNKYMTNGELEWCCAPKPLVCLTLDTQ